MNEMLKNIPDKRQDKNTTSLKFKEDLIDFFGDDYKDKTCLEIGTSKGYTTRVLSFLFKKVITCEINDDLISFAKDVNKDRDNIEFLKKDVYGTPWNFNDVDMVFIDCDHQMTSVLHDIKNAISLCKPNDDIMIIFDDYGLSNPWKGVKDAIATYDNDPQFEIIKEIGEPEGSDCNPRANLIAVEGVICKYTNKKTPKNIVFIPNIDVGDDRSKPYNYSIKSWEKWCENNNCELLVLDELIYPIEEMKITWQRWYIFDILEANGIELKDDQQIALVDADMVVHPDCPDFFEHTDMKWAGVLNNGSYEWVVRSINGYGDLMFNGNRISPWEYINNGLVIFNNKHREFIQSIIGFYWDNKDEIIDSYDKIRCSTDQTIINYLRVLDGVETIYLQDRFNLQDLHSKQLLYHDPSNWWGDSISNLLQSGYIFHINAIPQNRLNRNTGYWIERIYKEMHPND